MGDLVLELEEFVTVPASFGGGSGRARISIMRSLPDGRLFVNDLRGQLYLVSEGSTSEYLNLGNVFPAFDDAPGLGTGFHSFAFHPDFADNGKFYTVHTEPARTATADFQSPIGAPNNGPQGVLTEWTANDPGADAFSGTRREVFRVDFPNNVHGIQEITFNPTVDPGDPDYGMLYVCIGEGGSYLDGYADNEHRLDSAMGTIFRIDPLGSDSRNGQYGIPEDNPWADAGDPSILREIYAYGFRNPHRLSWDRGGGNLAFVGDIGERNLEELNILLPGADYGFPQREGTFLLRPDAVDDGENYEVFPLPENDDEFGYTYPVAQYDHDEGFAIIGGYVYRGDAIPELHGTYVFGDIKNGRVLYVHVDDLELGTQTPIQEARVSIDGTEASLESIVGNSRVDLRFGLDGDDELYFMTKADGVVRKVTSVDFDSVGGLDNDPGNWQIIDDFEEGLARLNIERIAENGLIRASTDPFGDAENTVLEMRGAGGNASHELPGIAGDGMASIYFRFAFDGTDLSGSVGPSDSPAAFLASHIQAEIHASSSGPLLLRDGTELEEVANTLRPGLWYEGWILFNGTDDSYDFYLRGDTFSAPALLASGLRSRLPRVGVLRKFLWTVSGDSGAGSIYFDDLFIDTTGGNLSSPAGNSWQLVANFETQDALDGWSLFNADAEDVQWEVEPSGNAYLSVRATAEPFTRTMLIAPLPHTVEVADVVTLYGRMQPESHAVNTVWGLSGQAASAFPSLTYDAFEVIGRMMDDATDYITIRDGESYVPARGGDVGDLRLDTWYEYWFVVRNGGEASGGQTFDVYWRRDDNDAEPAKVYTNADFRISEEAPLTQFAIIANDGANGANGRMRFDDIFLVDGEVLSRPGGTGTGLFPGPLGEKTSPWFGQLWDDHLPWIYHSSHHWVYVPNAHDENIWLYDMQLGWLFTTPSVYPHIYMHLGEAWNYYLPTSADPRWFYNFSTETWDRVEME